jgi:hypothetical protein
LKDAPAHFGETRIVSAGERQALGVMGWEGEKHRSRRTGSSKASAVSISRDHSRSGSRDPNSTPPQQRLSTASVSGTSGTMR